MRYDEVHEPIHVVLVGYVSGRRQDVNPFAFLGGIHAKPLGLLQWSGPPPVARPMPLP